MALSSKIAGQKGKNVSSTLKAGRTPTPLGSENRLQMLVLNSGQAVASLLRTEPAI